MKCHYEILEVERSADESEIKVAYRKLALKWHPDKNPDNPTAKEQFQQIQQAYEILSDPHERAWYDNHRDQILRGCGTDYKDESLNVYEYFTVTCFSGYDDNNPRNFYAVYGEIFRKISAEDLEFIDSDTEEIIPEFGMSTSDYDTCVGPFYAYWQSYCTKKSYSWLSPHNINELKDRRLLRIVDKETKKIAQKAKRERNDEVRALVAFVRKRDKRIEQHRIYLEQKTLENRKKQEQKRMEQIRKNKLDLEMVQQQQNAFTIDNYEHQLKQLQQSYASSNESDGEDDVEVDEDVAQNDINDDRVSGGSPEQNGHISDESSVQDVDNYIDDLYCIACNKAFTNQASFKNHSTSKKHLNNVEKLKLEMINDNEELLRSDNFDDDDIAVAADSNSNSDTDDCDAFLIQLQNETNRKKRKSRKKEKHTKNNEEIADLENSIETITVNDEISSPTEILDTIDLNNRDEINSDLNKKNKKTKTKTKNKKLSNISEDVAKLKDIDLNHICATCSSKFESKNKLFNHIRETKHSIYLPSSVKEASSSSGGVSSSSGRQDKRGKKNRK